MKQLEELDLSENKNFSAFPASFSEVKLLKKINLTNTAIQELPYELQYWTVLSEFICRENTQLETLPESIGNLKLIARLDFDTCSLKALPDQIGNLSKYAGS